MRTAKASRLQQKRGFNLRPRGNWVRSVSMPELARSLYGSVGGVIGVRSPQHRTKLHSTNPIERFNGEIKRRTRYMTLETIAPLSDDPTVSLPAIAS